MNKNLPLGLCVAGLLAAILACSSDATPPTFAPFLTSTPLITAPPDVSPIPEIGSTPNVGIPIGAPTVQPNSPPGQVGAAVVVAGMSITVNRVWGVTTFNDIEQAAASNVFIVADVTIENVNADVLHYNPLLFKVKDAGNYEYDADFIAPDPSLKSGDLGKGEKVRGNIAFEVPRTSKAIVVSFQPLILDDSPVLSVFLGDAPAAP